MVIVAGTVTVKGVLLTAVPVALVTEITPDVPVPTVAVIVVGETTVNEVAAVPPKVTEVVPVKFVPAIVTTVPAGPLAGEKLVMVGNAGAVTVKSALLTCVQWPLLSLA